MRKDRQIYSQVSQWEAVEKCSFNQVTGSFAPFQGLKSEGPDPLLVVRIDTFLKEASFHTATGTGTAVGNTEPTVDPSVENTCQHWHIGYSSFHLEFLKGMKKTNSQLKSSGLNLWF